jgi:hypothetical protein
MRTICRGVTCYVSSDINKTDVAELRFYGEV